ncbi:MAG: excinuclease ABC subunit UvrA, partial [Francisellaceae bacterium]|nr:excinuclease ABC subunit UvrA [Francisellaceae bacterium]
IYDYLRLLYARVGTPQCPQHSTTLEAQTISQIVDDAMLLPENSKVMILSPLVRNKKGEHQQIFESLKSQGYIRVRVNKVMYDLGSTPKLNVNQKHSIEVIVDRLKIREDIKTRLADSIESSVTLSSGLVIIANIDNDDFEKLYSTKYACNSCGYSIPELEPRLFSFNNPTGACPTCDGLGHKQYMDTDKIIYDESLSLSEGAIRGWDKNAHYYHSMLTSLADYFEFSMDKPYEKLSKKVKQLILYGSRGIEIDFTFKIRGKNPVTRTSVFEGVIPNMERRYKDSDSEHVREELSKFITNKSCETCGGHRLNESARHVFITEINLPSLTTKTIEDLCDFFKNLTLTGWRNQVASKILKEIQERLGFLLNVGLDYLTLNRSADTLSGGEAQRIRLASQIGAGLVGVMYVLDEPSIGLHQRDNQRLIDTLTHLRDLGNTVIVVEHDEDAISCADHVIDIGPGAGIHGGEVVAEGKLNDIKNNKNSLTGQYLSGKLKIEVPQHRAKVCDDQWIKIVGAKANNLQNVCVDIPIGIMTCVTGVSGSGKSSLINETLYPLAAKCLNGAMMDQIGEYESISGLEHFLKVVNITQQPIGRTPRSNPATYTGIFTDIRDLFAGTSEARTRGYKPGRFSFNVKGGRCEACQGDGVLKVEMHFLPDVFVPCDVCFGKRYNRETLEVTYKSKNIHHVLDMTIESAVTFFENIPVIKRKLQTLIDVGLSYIKLGQSATTLSGGEAQRIKLSKELSKREKGQSLYILDEPTTGLHFHDVNKLLSVLRRLQEHGNTIVIIEHNLDVIKTADWVIDIGPEGGYRGGKIIASGTPEDVAKVKTSYTGHYLKEMLENAKQ